MTKIWFATTFILAKTIFYIVPLIGYNKQKLLSNHKEGVQKSCKTWIEN